MSRTIAVGIDIGTHHVKVVAAEHPEGHERPLPRIIGTGFSESRGLRHGYIINKHEITRSVTSAIKQAEKAAGIQIKKAYLSIGGIGVGIPLTDQSKGSVVLADNVVLGVFSELAEGVPGVHPTEDVVLRGFAG